MASVVRARHEPYRSSPVRPTKIVRLGPSTRRDDDLAAVGDMQRERRRRVDVGRVCEREVVDAAARQRTAAALGRVDERREELRGCVVASALRAPRAVGRPRRPRRLRVAAPTPCAYARDAPGVQRTAPAAVRCRRHCNGSERGCGDRAHAQATAVDLGKERRRGPPERRCVEEIRRRVRDVVDRPVGSDEPAAALIA